ncbi:MAG: replication-associated recombination protein A [Clostridia bacterium]|nr:replication-associated recombination protein A [Clostridia bacterium]
MNESQPLAYRMRPKSLEEFVGQEHIIGKDKLLYRTIKADRLSSLILWGPPGCGKTSLAKVISETTKYQFKKINAVTSGVSDIKNAVQEASNLLMNPTGKCILFIDEIHRFNKLQQDALLPYVEDGTVILIGATTENPYFEVNKALISRSMVIKLEPLKKEDIIKVIKNALISKEGLGNYNVKISEDTIEKIAEISGGDVRTALNGLEIAVLTTKMNSKGEIEITDEIAAQSFNKKKSMFDKSGDSHYDNISAMIKSLRGSDPDAAIFYLARAIDAGEDPMFLARRLVISASEDVGLANPQALVIATSAMQAVSYVGMPEGRIILAEAAIYIAKSKKSNASYNAINKALADVSSKDTGTIPMHIRNAPAEGMTEFGYGQGYKYPHDYPGHYVEQQYLPDKMLGTKYYIPDENITDKKITSDPKK